jgi:hypothetical protein
MARGGARPNAGRKPAGRNRLTKEAVAKAGDGLSPLEYLLSVMRDPDADQARRIDAAKAAAPYAHPKLQPIDGEGDTKQTHVIQGSLAWQPPE